LRVARPQLTGLLKMTPEALGWKADSDGGKIVAVAPSDLKNFRWFRLAHAYQLRIQLQNNTVLRLNGFSEAVRVSAPQRNCEARPLSLASSLRRLAHGHGAQDKETLEKFIKRSYDMTLETRELSTKGWNWGDIDVAGASPPVPRSRGYAATALTPRAPPCEVVDDPCRLDADLFGEQARGV